MTIFLLGSAPPQSESMAHVPAVGHARRTFVWHKRTNGMQECGGISARCSSSGRRFRLSFEPGVMVEGSQTRPARPISSNTRPASGAGQSKAETPQDSTKKYDLDGFVTRSELIVCLD